MTGASYYQPSGVYKNSGGVHHRGGTDGSNGSFSPAHSPVVGVAGVDVRFQAVFVGVVEVQRPADALVDGRDVDASVGHPLVERREFVVVGHLEGGVVQADPGALARRVRPYPLEGDVVVVLAERQERVPAVPFGHRQFEDVGVEGDAPVDITHLQVDVAEVWHTDATGATG